MNPSWIHLGRWFMDRMSCMRREGRMPVAALTRLYHLHPCRRERAAVKMRFSPCFKISDLRHCQIIRLGAAHPYVARKL